MFLVSRISQFYTIETQIFLGEDPQTPLNTFYKVKNYHGKCVFV